MYYLPFILLIKLFYAGAWLIEKPVNSEGQSHNSYAMTDNLFESFEDYAYDKYKLFSDQINLDNQMDNLPGGGYPIFINYHKRCPDGFTGLIAHPLYEQNYYICEKSAIIHSRCRGHQIFDAANGTCSLNPLEQRTPVCKVMGYFPITSNQNLYYRCTSELKPQISKCPAKEIFSPLQNACIKEHIYPPTVITPDGSVIPSNDEEKFPPCRQTGIFRSTFNCSLYFTCTWLSNRVFLQTRYRCPQGEFFDKITKHCRNEQIVRCPVTALLPPSTTVRYMESSSAAISTTAAPVSETSIPIQNEEYETTTTEAHEEAGTTLDIFEATGLESSTMEMENLQTERSYPFDSQEKTNEALTVHNSTDPPLHEDKSVSEEEDVTDICDESVSYETLSHALLCRASLESTEVHFSKKITAQKSDIIIPASRAAVPSKELEDVTTHVPQPVLSPEATMSDLVPPKLEKSAQNFTTLSLKFGPCKENNGTNSCLNIYINRPFSIQSVACSSNCTMSIDITDNNSVSIR